MGTKYPSQSATGYNSGPPADDGSTVASNKITWSTIKTKLPDPVKNLADAMNSALVTALDVSASSTSVNYTTLTSDHLKPILCTGTITISLGDATTMGIGYQVPVVNIGTGVITVTTITGTDTLNGTAGGSITLGQYEGMTFETLPSALGYVVMGRGLSTPYHFDTFTRDISVTSDESITGVGFKPKAIIFIGGNNSTQVFSIGMDNGSKRICIADDSVDSAGTYAVSTANSMIFAPATGANNQANIKTFDADGFTLQWSKTGSPTGTVTVGYLALR